DQIYFHTEIEPLLSDPLIEYLGEITDAEKNEFLGHAMALVCPYDWPEPFGLVLIEALACGTPVLAYRRGSIPEIIEDGATGFVSGAGGQDGGFLQLQKEVHMNSLKSTSLATAMVTVGLVWALGTLAEAQSPLDSTPSKVVTGEVAQVKGEFHMAKDPKGEFTLDIVDKSYVITSQAGEEVRLELDD